MLKNSLKKSKIWTQMRMTSKSYWTIFCPKIHHW